MRRWSRAGKTDTPLATALRGRPRSRNEVPWRRLVFGPGRAGRTTAVHRPGPACGAGRRVVSRVDAGRRRRLYFSVLAGRVHSACLRFHTTAGPAPGNRRPDTDGNDQPAGAQAAQPGNLPEQLPRAAELPAASWRVHARLHHDPEE